MTSKVERILNRMFSDTLFKVIWFKVLEMKHEYLSLSVYAEVKINVHRDLCQTEQIFYEYSICRMSDVYFRLGS